LEILGESATVTITVWPLERGIGLSYLRQVWRSEVSRHLEDEIVSDLETVVSELGTNALVLTDGECELRIVRSAGALVLCEVADADNHIELIAVRLAKAINDTSTDSPIVTDGDAYDGHLVDPKIAVADLEEGGFGLGIVASLSHGKCGVRPTRLHSSGFADGGVDRWVAAPGPASRASRAR
jgi:hypothetical protein